jgi:hypothetical protein
MKNEQPRTYQSHLAVAVLGGLLGAVATAVVMSPKLRPRWQQVADDVKDAAATTKSTLADAGRDLKSRARRHKSDVVEEIEQIEAEA